MDALVFAGGVPQPDDPLYAYTQGKPEALLEIAGLPLAQWVLNALSDAHAVDRVVVVGLDADPGLTCEKPLAFEAHQGDLLQNLQVAAERLLGADPGAERVLCVASDIPAITGKMIDRIVNASLETMHDVYFYVVARKVMNARYPGSRRTFVHLKGNAFCRGDINVFRLPLATIDEELRERILAARKSPLRQAALVGLDSLLLFLLRRLTIEEAAERVSERFGIRCRAIVCPYAEVGMDVDRPRQLEMLRADLS